MGESKHGRHILLITIVITRHPQNKTGAPFGAVTYTGKDQIPVIIVTVQQETVVAEIPIFPRQESYILRFNGQYLTPAGTVKGLDLRIPLAETVPHLLRQVVLLFFLLQPLKFLGISQYKGLLTAVNDRDPLLRLVYIALLGLGFRQLGLHGS